MRLIETVAAMVTERRQWDMGDRDVGLVATMGYLHAGHASLVRQARAENEIVVVSIFVNPTQFGPGEDLTRYPRDLPRDLALLEASGADVVFTPQPADIYPPGFATYVVPQGAVSERLEAASRPGHFRGVATVVAKLYHIVRPRRAYFGQKDGQQVAVLRRMGADLNFALDLRVLPTLREPDGLALSSRNAYLGPEDRLAAAVLRRALEAGRARFVAHGMGAAGGPAAVLDAMRMVVAAEPRAALDYADLCDPDSFAPLTTLRAPALLAIAARVGPARLIDNYLLRADGTWETGTLVE
ncbi:MAG TPA: pantoate--beta-alanine ligase [Ktedonobacterales bacterium]|nr:pantoate--beta-alanine ligase [Ktedonobacterales bacterium]